MRLHNPARIAFFGQFRFGTPFVISTIPEYVTENKPSPSTLKEYIMNKHLQPVRTSVITALLLSSLAAAGDQSFFRENHCWWTTFGMGYAHTQDPFGIALAVNHTQRLSFHQLTVRTMHYNDVQIFESSQNWYAFDIGLLYGPHAHFTLFMKERENAAPLWWSMSMSLSAGISYTFGTVMGDYLYSEGFFESVYEEVHMRTAGFPVQLELRLIPSSKISIDLNGSANVNSTESFYSGWLGVSYGIQRIKSDSLRHIAYKALSSGAKKRRTVPRILLGVASAGSAAGAIIKQVRMRDAKDARDDYREMRNGSSTEADHNRYDEMVKEETKCIASSRKARNIFLGLGAASFTGLSLSFAF